MGLKIILVMLTYSIIRKNYQSMIGFHFHDRLLLLISPFFTLIFVKYHVIPNIVTVFMMILGVLGALFFAFPIIVFKIIGIICIYLWYTMDCSDGEVARITQKFSIYGKEIDYTAHVIDHPLFTLAFMMSVVQYNLYFVFSIAIMFIIDTLYRHLRSFDVIKNLKEPSKITSPKGTPRFKISKIPNIIFYNLANFPEFVLFFPIVLLIDWKIAFYYNIIAIVASVIMVGRGMAGWLKYIVYK